VYVPANSYYNSTTKTDATDFYEFSPKSNTWRIKATFNIGELRRFGYGLSFTHKGKFYVGLTNNYPTKILEFDLETQKYITKYDYSGKKPFDFSAYSKMNATYINGKVYMLVIDSSLNKFIVFDVEQNSYSELTPLPIIGSYDPLITSVNGKVYAMVIDGVSNSKKGRLFMYDPSTKIWAEKASGLPFQKYSTYNFQSLTSIGSKIYAINAWGAAEYNTETNTWRKVLDNKDLIGDLDSKALGIADGKIYLGLKSGSQKINWYEFKP
jgi:DNA-binding beta-propeller fold protein YncE